MVRCRATTLQVAELQDTNAEQQKMNTEMKKASILDRTHNLIPSVLQNNVAQDGFCVFEGLEGTVEGPSST